MSCSALSDWKPSASISSTYSGVTPARAISSTRSSGNARACGVASARCALAAGCGCGLAAAGPAASAGRLGLRLRLGLGDRDGGASGAVLSSDCDDASTSTIVGVGRSSRIEPNPNASASPATAARAAKPRAARDGSGARPTSRTMRSKSEPPFAAIAKAGASEQQPLELDERAGVAHRVAAGGHREVVAAVLALDAHAVRHPPHGGVVEEQRLGRGLQQVHQVVVAADVRQLVGQDQLELLRR